MRIHIGQVVASDRVVRKLREKHRGLTLEDVRDAVQWPARPQVAWENHPEHGRRLVAVGTDHTGRAIICALTPIPDWDDNADTWTICTARWL